jgi:hypothetical protein
MTCMLSAPVDVRDPYASYGKSTYVATFHADSTELDRFTALEKNGSRLNPQHAG